MQAMTWPEVKVEVFEGPFDLLLELAAVNKVDLRDISLSALAADFVEYLRKHDVSLRSQGEWLLIAAKLLLLKARAASGRDLTAEEVEEEQDLRERVLVYQVYRQKAEWLRALWGSRQLMGPGERVRDDLPLVKVEKELLSDTFKGLLRGLPRPEQARAHLVRYGRTLDQCLVAVREVLAKRPSFVFQQEVQQVSRAEAAVTFLALLELYKGRQAQLEQRKPFDELIVSRL